MTAKKVLLSVTETVCNPFVQKLGFLVFAGNIPHFTKDYFGPKSTQSIFLVDRPHICETIGNLLTIRDNHLERSGAIASVIRESGTEKKIKTRRPLVVLVVRGSSKNRLVSPALWSFGIISRALFYPWELSYTLCSSLLRIVLSVSQRIDSN